MKLQNIDVPLNKIRAPRPRRTPRPCSAETRALNECIGNLPKGGDESACESLKQALSDCYKEAAKLRKTQGHKPTTNYHLARLARKVFDARK